jgi:small subunit ribosomal protein S16
VLPQPEKPNKTDAFNAALAEAGKEPKAAANKTAKKATSKPESTQTDPAKVEGSPQEAQQAADAGVADADSSES